MTKLILILIPIIIEFSTSTIQSETSQTFNCPVEVSGLKSNSGKCIFYLYKDKKGFPTDSKNAVATITASIKDGKAVGVFKGVTPGDYAVSVIHDENGNGKLDTNFLGIPKEGIGTSNNAKSTFGPPSFEASRFNIPSQSNTINITINYL